MAEIEYYRSGTVVITSTRAIFASKMYAVNGLTSTEVVEISPSRAMPILLLMIGLAWGGCCGVGPLGCVGRADGDRENAIIASMNILIGFGAVLSAIVWMARQEMVFAVLLCTSAAEIQAYLTNDVREADQIVRAIHKAIIARG